MEGDDPLLPQASLVIKWVMNGGESSLQDRTSRAFEEYLVFPTIEVSPELVWQDSQLSFSSSLSLFVNYGCLNHRPDLDVTLLPDMVFPPNRQPLIPIV